MKTVVYVWRNALLVVYARKDLGSVMTPRRPGTSKSKPRLPVSVAPATPACEVELDSDMPDRRPGTSKSKPRLPVSVAPATLDSDVAHPTKRAKKVPQRLKE